MYHICKDNEKYTGEPYKGMTCRVAHVPSGKTYDSLEECKKDAAELERYNSAVGYLIYNVKTKKVVK